MADKPQNKQTDKNQTENKNKEKKERAVNPLAMRPDDVRVTMQSTPPVVNIIKKIFGF